MKSISNSFLNFVRFYVLLPSGYIPWRDFFSVALIFEARDCKCKFQNSLDRISSRVVCWSYMFESHTFREKEDLWYFLTVLIHGLPNSSWCFLGRLRDSESPYASLQRNLQAYQNMTSWNRKPHCIELPGYRVASSWCCPRWPLVIVWSFEWLLGVFGNDMAFGWRCGWCLRTDFCCLLHIV